MKSKKKFVVIIPIILVVIILLVFINREDKDDDITTKTIIFLDSYSNNEISSQVINIGDEVNVPENPVHEGQVFIGWFLDEDRNKKITDFKNITGDMKVVALYGADINGNGIADSEEATYTVTFVDSINGSVIGVENVLEGMDAKAPQVPVHDNYSFIGWSRSYMNVRENITVKANYRKYSLPKVITHVVTFVDGENGKVISTQRIENGLTATAPIAPLHEKRVFSYWDQSFYNVTKDITIKAIYADDINMNGIDDRNDDYYNVKFSISDKFKKNEEVYEYSVLNGLLLSDAVLKYPDVDEIALRNYRYSFEGWDITSDTKITSNVTIEALLLDLGPAKTELSVEVSDDLVYDGTIKEINYKLMNVSDNIDITDLDNILTNVIYEIKDSNGNVVPEIIDAGTYTIDASFKGTANYLKSNALTKNVVVNQADSNIIINVPEDNELIYDGNDKSSLFSSVINDFRGNKIEDGVVEFYNSKGVLVQEVILPGEYRVVSHYDGEGNNASAEESIKFKVTVGDATNFRTLYYYNVDEENVMTLANDIDVQSIPTKNLAGKTIIDLNGHVLNFPNRFKLKNGVNVVIKNGTINVTGSGNRYVGFEVNNGGYLELENVKVTSTGALNSVFYANGGKIILNKVNIDSSNSIRSIGAIGGDVEIKESTINVENSKGIEITSGGKTILDNVSLNVKNSIGVLIYDDNSSINIKNNSNITADEYAITTQASLPDNVKIDIDSSNITSTGAASILLNIPSEMNINRSKIKGYTHGVIVRGGTANISNTVIESTIDNFYYADEEWGSGSFVANSALTIGNRTASGYRYPTNVTLSNVTLISNGNCPKLYAYGNPEDNNGVILNIDEVTLNSIGDKGLFNEDKNVTINRNN